MADTPIADPGYPVFAAIAKELYGDVLDPRELWDLAKANDASEVHVETADPAAAKARRNRKIAATGLAATGVATAGGMHALVATGQHHQAASEAIKAGTWKAGPILSHIKVSPKTALGLGTAGWVGLHGVELVGDSLAARAQVKAMRANPKPPPAPKAPAKPEKVVQAKALVSKGWRTKKVVMTPAQAKELREALTAGSSTGVKLAMGATGVAGLAVGHHLGVRAGQKRAEQAAMAKAFRVRPLNAASVRRVVSLKARRPPMSPPLSKAAALTWSGVISKLDEDRHQVFGWCSLSTVDGQPVVDLQGDWVPLDEIEKSAYKYVIESRKGGDMHKRVAKWAGDQPLHTADLIESFVVTPDKLRGMGLADDALPHGWWVGFKVNDEEQWAKVKTGERTGFSIHGTGMRRAA